MKNNVKRIAATALAAMMALTSTAGAMAAEYYSGSLNIKRRVVLPAATEEPAQETVAETAAEPTVEPTVEPTAEPAVQPEEVVEDVAEESAAESAEEPAEEAPVIDVSKLKVEIFTTQGDAVMLGETITLSCKLTGFDGLTYKVQWQFNDGSGWQNVPEATEETYSFAADEENVSYSWRLAVSL